MLFSLITLPVLALAAPIDSLSIKGNSLATARAKAIRGTSLEPYLHIHAAHLSARDASGPDSGVTLITCKTNAECLQRDLPLLKPSPRSRSKTGALAPRQSGAPPISGSIQVLFSNGTVVGYMTSTLNTGYYGVTADFTDALVLSLIPGVSQQSATIAVAQQAPGGYAYLGVGGLLGDGIFTSTDVTYSLFVGTSFDLPPGPADFIDTTFGFLPSETDIYRLDASNNLLIDWVNPDGVEPAKPQLFWDQYFNYLGLSGNITAFADAFSTEDIVPVSFKFVPSLSV